MKLWKSKKLLDHGRIVATQVDYIILVNVTQVSDVHITQA